MKNFLSLQLLTALLISHGSGAADYEVERVRSPYVETKDLGPMMEAESTQGMMQRKPSGSYRTYSNFGRHSTPCLSCQHRSSSHSSFGTGGIPSGSSSYSSSSSYASFAGMGSNPVYTQPIQSSSRHEVKKEQEFMNGQQVYDFHHEKKYRDGKLIDEKRYENAPDDYGAYSQPGQAYSPSYSGGSTKAFSSSQAHFNTLSPSDQHGHYQGYGLDHSVPGVDNLSEQFQSEVERMREELRRKTLSLPHQQVIITPKYGGSHKTEYRTETKYVNGNPVYMLNEEKKYKDGKLIHNVTEEKGPEDLGTADITVPGSVLSSPTGNIYSSNQQEIRTQSQHHSSQYPQGYPSSYPSYYSPGSSDQDTSRESLHRPLSYGYSSDISASSVAYPSSGSVSATGIKNTEAIVSSQPSASTHYYSPSSVYSTQIKKEHKESETQTSAAYHPDTYQNVHTQYTPDNDRHSPSQNSDSYESFYHRPEANTYIPYTTTTTTPRPSYNNYEHSSTYTQTNKSPTYNHISQYDTQKSSSSVVHSSHQSSQTTQRPYYSPERTPDNNGASRLPYNSRPYGSGPSYTPTTEGPHREAFSGYKDSGENVQEVSQSPYYDSNPSRARPYNRRPSTYVSPAHATEHQPTYGSAREVHRAEDKVTTSYQPSSYRQRHQEGEYEENYITPDRSETRDSEVYSSSTSNQEMTTHRRYPSNIGPHRPKGPERSPSLAPGLPRATNHHPGSDREPETDKEENERYDISPFDDAAAGSDDNADDTRDRRVQYENQPYNPGTSSSYSHTNTYEESKKHLVSPSKPVNYNQSPSYPDRSSSTGHRYSSIDSKNVNQLLTIPSKWVEISTTSSYMNGKLASETQHRRYYENGVIVHQNTTHKTRDELIAEGVNVHNLDLSPSQLAQYGSVYSTKAHSQRHEVQQIQKFRNGQQIYELNEERRYQDGNLVHEDRDEKDEDDFSPVNFQDEANRQITHPQDFNNRHFISGGSGLHSQAYASNPETYSRKHEIRQEEEYVNGKKVYNFHHEREFEDGKLIHENKTEYGPEQLGTQTAAHRDALKDLLSGSSLSQTALHEQQRRADSVLTTSCLTCGHGQAANTITGGSAMVGSIGMPPGQGYSAGSTFRQDLNVEEHYENGQLVKGRKEDKKWIDGKLVDAKEQHYYDGPSRVNMTLTPGYSSGALTTGSVAHTAASVGECSYNPCLNLGRCKMGVGGPVCICPFGFRGHHCEEAYCPSRYCRYGGSCSVISGKQECSCPEGYSGYRCSTQYQTVKLGTSG